MNKIGISLGILSIFLFFSCEKKYDDLIPSKFDTILVLQETGENNLTLYNTGEDGAYSVTVFKSGNNPKSTAQAAIRTINNTDLEQYNQDTGANFVALPASLYQLESSTVEFASSELHKKVNVSLKTSEINTLITDNPDVSYVLPLELAQTNKKDSVNAEKRRIFLKPLVVTPVLLYNESSATLQLSQSETHKTYEFRLKLPFVSPWDFECTVEASSTNNVFEAGQYTISNEGKIAFKAGSNLSDPVTITVLNSSDYVGTRSVLPLVITDVSKAGIVAPSSSFALEAVYGVGHNRLSLTTSMISANYTQADDGQGIPGLIDNNPSTYFHSKYWPDSGTAPHYIQVQLTSPITKMAFGFQGRLNNRNGNPQDIKISVSNDGVTWNELTRINSGLPTTAGSIYESLTYGSETAFSYVRFEVMQTTTGTAPQYFVFSEFWLYGK